MFQASFKNVSRVFQVRFMSVLIESKGLSREFQGYSGSFRGVSRVFKGILQGVSSVSKVFQRRLVLLLLYDCRRSFPSRRRACFGTLP